MCCFGFSQRQDICLACALKFRCSSLETQRIRCHTIKRRDECPSCVRIPLLHVCCQWQDDRWPQRIATNTIHPISKIAIASLKLIANYATALVSGEKSNFQFILRLLNTNVDGKQKIMYALTRIKGVGRRYSNLVCKKADVDLNKRYASLRSDLERN